MFCFRATSPTTARRRYPPAAIPAWRTGRLVACRRRAGASPRTRTGDSPLAATPMSSVLYRVYGAEREARTRLHREKGRSYDNGNLGRLPTRAERREPVGGGD